MRRFATNRWWAFILTLCVLLAASATLTAPSRAMAPDPIVIGGDTGGGSEGGDPDGPIGPSRRTPAGSRVAPGGSGYSGTAVGDGRAGMRVWSWRFHVVLRSLLGRFYRF